MILWSLTVVCHSSFSSSFCIYNFSLLELLDIWFDFEVERSCSLKVYYFLWFRGFGCLFIAIFSLLRVGVWVVWYEDFMPKQEIFHFLIAPVDGGSPFVFLSAIIFLFSHSFHFCWISCYVWFIFLFGSILSFFVFLATYLFSDILFLLLL